MPVSVLVIVTCAFGIDAPEASLTSPVIVAVSCCANATWEQENKRAKNRANKGLLPIVISSGQARWQICQIAGVVDRKSFLIRIWPKYLLTISAKLTGKAIR